MGPDLKFYSETTMSGAKNLNNKDANFSEKYDILKSIESRYKSNKIYYSKSFNSFLIVFETDKDEEDIYLFLAKLKKGYKGVQLFLEIENKETKNYFLKIEYNK